MKLHFFLICVLCASLADAESSLRLYHRIWDPSTTPPPFSTRAHIQNSPESGLVLAHADNPGQLFLGPDQPEGSLYQVALERSGDLSEDDWDVSSVKACHIAGIKSDVLVIHMSQSQQAYAVDYFVHPVPHDGSCPKMSKSRRQISFTNTTLITKSAIRPPSPELRPPPQLSPQGQPIQPQPEPSFIQKYWIYIALGLITLVVTGGGAPESEQGGQAQGGTSGGRAAGR